MRFAILALALLLPLAASAQTTPSRIYGGGGPGPPPGITVQGHGVTRFAVKTVMFVANARGAADEAGALAAMRSAGIDDASVGSIGTQFSTNNQTMLRGTIRDVSHAKLDRISQAAAGYVRSHPGASIDNVNFFPRIDDCVAQEQTARAAAMADAKRKAQGIAALVNATIDAVVAVNESGGCPSSDPPFTGGVPFDMATLTASISLYESVTFAIGQGPPPVRRRVL